MVKNVLKFKSNTFKSKNIYFFVYAKQKPGGLPIENLYS